MSTTPGMLSPPNSSLIDSPLYTAQDVVRYLRPSAWLASKFIGRLIPEFSDLMWYRRQCFCRPVSEDDIDKLGLSDPANRISFRQFAGCFAHFSVWDRLLEGEREESRSQDRDRNSFKSVDDVIYKLFESNGYPKSFLSLDADHLRQKFALLPNDLYHLAEKWFDQALDRIDFENGEPARLHPFSRDLPDRSPRLIVIDPRIRFGRPTLKGRGVPTDNIFERYQAGDSIAELADDYGVEALEVEEAIRYETLSNPRSLIFA